MSAYHLLYYPLFEPPITWLRSILLFVDSVRRVIPEGVKREDSKKLSQLREILPTDPAPSLNPTLQDLQIDRGDEHRMMNAFNLIIKTHAGRTTEQKELTFDYSFIHRAKVPYPVLALLKDSHLIDTHPYQEFEKFRKNGFLRIQKDAGHLILSYVAGQMARRNGLDAITDFKLGFAVNALDALGIDPRAGHAEGSLLSSIVFTQIPGELRYLSTKDYVDVRNSHSDIRAAFQHLARELAQDYRLDRFTVPSKLSERVETAAADFTKECSKFRRTRTGKSVKKWSPVSIGAIIGICASLGSTGYGIATKAAQFGLQVFDKKVNKASHDPRRDRTYQMLCGLQEDIIDRSPVKTFLHL